MFGEWETPEPRRGDVRRRRGLGFGEPRRLDAHDRRAIALLDHVGVRAGDWSRCDRAAAEREDEREDDAYSGVEAAHRFSLA